MQQHRPTYEVKIFLHMNLSYELIKHDKRNSSAVFAILTAEDINDTIHVIIDYRVGLYSFVVNKCDVLTRCFPMVLRRLTFQSTKRTE